MGRYRGLFDRGESMQHTMLVGDFPTSLSTAEQQQWCEYIQTRPEWAEFRQLTIQKDGLLASIAGGLTSLSGDYLGVSNRLNQVKDSLYSIARAWYADLLKRDAEEDAKEEAERAAETAAKAP